MTNSSNQYSPSNRDVQSIFGDWRVLVALVLVFCGVVFFVVPKRYLGVVRYQEKQSKIITALSSIPPDKSVLVINEIMYHPRSNTTDDEFLEILNTSEYRISLDGWHIQGVQYRFPGNAIIQPGEYIVVCANPERIMKKYHLPEEQVYGPYNAKLSNRGETLQLVRPDGSIEDEVTYDDGVHWDTRADGYGPSLELTNPELDNNTPAAWRISVQASGSVEGTPGKENSTYKEALTSIVQNVSFSPLVPRTDETITIRCEVFNKSTVRGVFLRFRTNPANQFRYTAMKEDGDSFVAEIPPVGKETVVEFFIEAKLENGSHLLLPTSGKGDPYVFMVEDAPYPDRLPVYRIVMSPRNYHTLTTRDLFNNEPLLGTFIAHGRAWLGVKIRYRGDSSRYHWKKSFRVNFPQNKLFNGRSVVYLNGSFWERQYVGGYLYSLTGIPTPRVDLVHLVVNGKDSQTYALVERVDEKFLERWFPNNAKANLYRGVGGANLDYRGEAPDRYRKNYDKINNKENDDFSDIIALCRAFSYPSDEGYLERIREQIDVEQWLTYFACTAALGNQEGIYYFPDADDYFLYRHPGNDKFVIIPWDFDSTCFPVNRLISEKATKNVRRFLFHPEILPRFYRKIYEMLSSTFTWENVKEEIQPLRDLIMVEKKYGIAAYKNIEKFLRTRSDTLPEAFPRETTARIITSYADTIIPPHDTWEVNVGWYTPPQNWKDEATTFTWYTFPAAFGYRHKSVRSLYDFSDYTSLYCRKRFTIPEGAALDNLRLCLEYSAGFVAYLNGKEIARRFMEPADTMPSHDSLATFIKNSARIEVFNLGKYSDILQRDSNNILAIQGHLHNKDDPYFVIHPWLISGGPEPYNAIINPDNRLHVGGTAPALDTEMVMVRNNYANYDPVLSQWRTTFSLDDGWNILPVSALDTNGEEIGSTTLQVFYSPRAHEISGHFTTDTVLARSDSPFMIKDSLVVDDGVTLSIEPGCVLIFSPQTGLDVRGTLLARGTNEQKIHFTSLDRPAGWNGIKFIDSRHDSILEHAVIENAAWWSNEHVGAVESIRSHVSLRNCEIKDTHLVGIDIYDSDVLIDSCHLHDTYSSYDGDIVQLRKSSTARIHNSLLERTNADAVDVSGGDLTITQTLIRNCGDKGLSLSGRGETSVTRAVIHDCTTGIGLKDNHLELHHTIITEHNNGLIFYYPDPGYPPKARLYNTIISRCSTPLKDLRSPDTLTTSDCYIEHHPALSVSDDFTFEQHFINIEQRDFRLFQGSSLRTAGTNGTPLIQTDWLNDLQW